MARIIVDGEVKQTFGTTFHQDMLDEHATLEEAISFTISTLENQDVIHTLRYVEEVLDESHTMKERWDAWYESGPDWYFDDEGLMYVMNFFRDELLKRKKFL